MKSTGEVMGTARSFGKAYDKAQDSTNKPIPESGTAVVDLSADEFPDPDTEAGESLVAGYAEHFELSEATDLIEAAKRGEIDLIVSRQRELLEVAVEEEITYFSTHASAKAALEAIDHKGDDLDVMAVSDRPKRVENWGAAEKTAARPPGSRPRTLFISALGIAAIVYKRYATCARLFIRLLAFRGPRPRRPSARRRTPSTNDSTSSSSPNEINSGPIAPTTSLRATTVRSIIRENASRSTCEENIVSDPPETPPDRRASSR